MPGVSVRFLPNFMPYSVAPIPNSSTLYPYLRPIILPTPLLIAPLPVPSSFTPLPYPRPRPFLPLILSPTQVMLARLPRDSSGEEEGRKLSYMT